MRSLHLGRWLALVLVLGGVASGAACALDTAGIPGDELDASPLGPDGAGADTSDDTTIVSDATTDALGDGGTDASRDVVVTDATQDADAVDAPSDSASDADDASDAHADASDASDAGTDAADAGVDAADSAPGPLAFRCGAGTVTSCSTCAGFVQPCVYCQPDGGVTTLSGVCTVAGLLCDLSIPAGSEMCPCAFPDASTCPEAYQACHNSGTDITCRTCGEPSTNGDSCHANGTCTAVTSTCN